MDVAAFADGKDVAVDTVGNVDETIVFVAVVVVVAVVEVAVVVVVVVVAVVVMLLLHPGAAAGGTNPTNSSAEQSSTKTDLADCNISSDTAPDLVFSDAFLDLVEYVVHDGQLETPKERQLMQSGRIFF